MYALMPTMTGWMCTPVLTGKPGGMDSALTVRLCCTDGHEFEFSYRLSPTEQVQLWEKMDAYCRQQNGQSLEEARAALLQTQAEEGMEIRM